MKNPYNKDGDSLAQTNYHIWESGYANGKSDQIEFNPMIANKFSSTMPKKWQLKCGGCGGEDHKLWKHHDRESIYVSCNTCESCSEICIPDPELHISWVDGSSGLLTTRNR
jgi:hypothetical protein